MDGNIMTDTDIGETESNEKYKDCPMCEGKGEVTHRKSWQQEGKTCKCMFCDGKGKLKIGKTE